MAPVFQTAIPTRLRTVDRGIGITKPFLDVRRIAAIAGLLHDLGKNNQFFAKKILKSEPIADPIRHEWLSACLIHEIAKTGSSQPDLELCWNAAAKEAENPRPDKTSAIVLGDGVPTPLGALIACISTHHRLYEEHDEKSARLGPAAFQRDQAQPGDDAVQKMRKPFPPDLWNRIVRAVRHIRDDGAPRAPLYWRGVAFLARAALILADHSVSAERMPEDPKAAPPWANTRKDASGKRRENQTLRWHLESVSTTAAAMAGRMSSLEDELEALSDGAVDGVDAPASGRFAWQEEAAEAVRKAREEYPLSPMLLQVIASTGSGKTRACARMAVRASVGRIRFSTLLNLRTLTLQTGQAYANQLRIGEDEMAVVIGDAIVREAVEAAGRQTPGKQPGQPSDADEELWEEMGEAHSDLGEDVEVWGDARLPQWLLQFVGDNPNLRAMLGAPVLVSTADYLVPAAEPGRQMRHVLSLLRTMTSDFVLDEIDNYDSKAVVAILRLVQVAAFCGRNVIASSATLSRTLSHALIHFYEHGAKMRAALLCKSEANPQPDFLVGVVSDLAPPAIEPFKGEDQAEKSFSSHVESVCCRLKSAEANAPRRARLVPVEKNEEGFYKAICLAAEEFHAQHKWLDPKTGKYLSIGLVRVANIGTAMETARRLRKTIRDNWRPIVLCYHSALFHGHRWMIERRLDEVLSRGKSAVAPADHPDIAAHLQREDVEEGIFIVVATPIEEVGRDHDFDWGVLEPSSAQSLVQAGGRVRRHRLEPALSPNVGILQFNLRECRGERLVFRWPGNEHENPYETHDLKRLLDWKQLEQSLDARLRFSGNHKLSAFDDERLEDALNTPSWRLLEKDSLWLSEYTYRNWPLRNASPTASLRYDPEKDVWMELVRFPKEGWKYSKMASSDVRTNFEVLEGAWMHFSPEEIRRECESYGLNSERHLQWAFEVEIINYKKENQSSIFEVTLDGVRANRQD
jgi:CRISPR-associated endonuclease/helicase Cas3